MVAQTGNQPVVKQAIGRCANRQLDDDLLPTLLARLRSAPLAAALRDMPIVCPLGPRQPGKTTLVRALEPRPADSALHDENAAHVGAGRSDGFVAALPRRAVLDDLQRVPVLLRAIRVALDRNRRPGRFVLTDSPNLLLLPGLATRSPGTFGSRGCNR